MLYGLKVGELWGAWELGDPIGQGGVWLVALDKADTYPETEMWRLKAMQKEAGKGEIVPVDGDLESDLDPNRLWI